MIRSTRRFTRTELQLRDHYFGLSQQVVQWCDVNGLSSHSAVGVSSPDHGTGVSTVSLNLAIALSLCTEQQVLLLQADVAHPFSTKNVKIKRQPGFAELLQQKVEIEDCLQPTPFEALNVISTGEAPRSQVMALPYHRAAELLTQLRSKFSMIVVDLPRVNPITPCCNIARNLDGTLVVVEQEKVKPELLARTRTQLDDAKAEMIGVIVNKKH